jgi:hypothetical protein
MVFFKIARIIMAHKLTLSVKSKRMKCNGMKANDWIDYRRTHVFIYKPKWHEGVHSGRTSPFPDAR